MKQGYSSRKVTLTWESIMDRYTETLSRTKDVFWNTRHYGIRSSISTGGCSLTKDGRRRRKRGLRNSPDLGRYPLHVVSVDLFRWFSKVYLTLLDLYSYKIWAFQMYGKSARVLTQTIQMFCNTVGFPLKSWVIVEENSLVWKTSFLFKGELLVTGQDISPLDAVLLLKDDNVELVFGEKHRAVDDLNAGDFCRRYVQRRRERKAMMFGKGLAWLQPNLVIALSISSQSLLSALTSW